MPALCLLCRWTKGQEWASQDSRVFMIRLVPRVCLAIMQRRAFLVVGPSERNDLHFVLHSLLMAHPSKFYISLKSFIGQDWAGIASECLLKRRYISLQNE